MGRRQECVARQRGLTVVEVLVAMVLLAVLLVPALHALGTGVVGTDVHRDVADTHFRLLGRLESVLAEPFSTLDAAKSGPLTPSSYSDAGGMPGRLLVFVADYDMDNADADNDPFTGTDADVLWIRVAVEGGTADLSSLVTR